MHHLAFVCLLVVVTLVGSVSFLRYYLKANISLGSCYTPMFCAGLGILVCAGLRSFDEAIIFFAASSASFAGFVFVSRLRQRNSFFWAAIGSLISNGAWYLTMNVLDGARAYWMLFILNIIGIVAGRTVGAAWSQYIEGVYNLKADATRLSPSETWLLMKKERIFPALLGILSCYCLFTTLFLGYQTSLSTLIVIGLSLFQSFTYSLNTRAVQRGNNWLIVTTGIIAGMTFYLTFVYILFKNMSLVLFIPYTLANTLGTITGVFFSMLLEQRSNTKPDSHLDMKPQQQMNRAGQSKVPHALLGFVILGWIFYQKDVFSFFGYPIHQLNFPITIIHIDLPRAFIMLVGVLVCFSDEFLQALNSRAGNRDHVGYHVFTSIPKGLSDFFKRGFIILNSTIPDLLPVLMLAGCFGSLFGKDIAQKIERWLQARMDVLPDEKTKKQ